MTITFTGSEGKEKQPTRLFADALSSQDAVYAPYRLRCESYGFKSRTRATCPPINVHNPFRAVRTVRGPRRTERWPPFFVSFAWVCPSWFNPWRRVAAYHQLLSYVSNVEGNEMIRETWEHVFWFFEPSLVSFWNVRFLGPFMFTDNSGQELEALSVLFPRFFGLKKQKLVYRFCTSRLFIFGTSYNTAIYCELYK